MPTEAFPNISDEEIARMIENFLRSIATLTGVRRFHAVVAFWSEHGITSCSTAGPQTSMTITILENILDDMRHAGGRVVDVPLEQ